MRDPAHDRLLNGSKLCSSGLITSRSGCQHDAKMPDSLVLGHHLHTRRCMTVPTAMAIDR
jgi:hypothetical protein